MNKLFNLADLKKPVSDNILYKDDIARQKFVSEHYVKCENIKQLTGNFPSTDEILFLWTLNSFNAFTFVPFIIHNFGKIEILVFSTYSINTRIVNSLIRWMQKGKIDHIHIFISDSMKFRMPKVVDLLNSYVSAIKNITVDYVWNHSKITLIKTGQHHFVIEGSGNFSENAQHEQYVFMDNMNVYNFRFNNITNAARELTG